MKNNAYKLYKKNPRVRMEVWKRDNFTCQYCGREMRHLYEKWLDKKIKRKEALITIDHIIPTSKGGSWELHNLITACHSCNSKKSNHEIEKPIPTRSQAIISGLLDVLVMWGKWAEKRRVRNSPYFRAKFK